MGPAHNDMGRVVREYRCIIAVRAQFVHLILQWLSGVYQERFRPLLDLVSDFDMSYR